MEETSNVAIVIGLGNPGNIYRETRHNVGFMAIDHLAGPDAPFERKGLSLITKTNLADREVVLAKPQTYMNRSGQAVDHLVKDFGSTLPNLLVIYDDAEIPFGHLRLRERGSHAGHNGMKSIVAELGASDVPRIRVGIGRSGPRPGLADHVLEEFSEEEQTKLPRIFDAARGAIELFLGGQVGKAMSLYNRRDMSVDQLYRETPEESKCTPS